MSTGASSAPPLLLHRHARLRLCLAKFDSHCFFVDLFVLVSVWLEPVRLPARCLGWSSLVRGLLIPCFYASLTTMLARLEKADWRLETGDLPDYRATRAEASSIFRIAPWSLATAPLLHIYNMAAAESCRS